MKKIITVTLSILIFLPCIGFSQMKKIIVKDLNLKNSYEEINVLKSNKEIKDGNYKRIINGKLSVDGNYKNNKRIGIWKVYDYWDRLAIEIDYSTGLIKYLTIDSITKNDKIIECSINTNGDRPLLIISSQRNILEYLTHLIEYPPLAQEKGISGQVIIEVKVDSSGLIIDYVVNKSVDNSLDQEAIRVFKLMPLEFLPEIKNGKPVNSKLKVPVNFVL